MRVIAKSTLKNFWKKHPKSEHALLDWYEIVKIGMLSSPNDVKSLFGGASIVGNHRIVFNIKGNDYRLVVEVDYEFQILFIIWAGTNKEYDKIDVTKIEYDG